MKLGMCDIEEYLFIRLSVSIEWIVGYLAICWLPACRVPHLELIINSFTGQCINCILDTAVFNLFSTSCSLFELKSSSSWKESFSAKSSMNFWSGIVVRLNQARR